MKRIVRWLCPVLFLLICAGVIWSLHLFVEVKGHMEYITWDSSVQILSDGTEVPFETDTYSNISDTKGSYRFSGRLPEGLPAGSLFFETSGCSVTLSLNGTEIYRSSAAASQDAAMMSQVTIPLPQGTTGTITMDYTVSDGAVPRSLPQRRFMPTFFTHPEQLFQRSALPAGAAALAFLLVTQAVSSRRHVPAAGSAPASAHGRHSWTDFLSDDPGTGITFSPGSRLAVF